MNQMQIGELARRFDVPVETIRYYEREGLIERTTRSVGNYRLYGEQHADQLGFIVSCRALDMSQEEIRELLRLRSHPDSNCGDVNALIDRHIETVETQVSRMTGLLKDLQALRRRCDHESRICDCDILTGLRGRTGVSQRGEVSKKPSPRSQATRAIRPRR